MHVKKNVMHPTIIGIMYKNYISNIYGKTIGVIINALKWCEATFTRNPLKVYEIFDIFSKNINLLTVYYRPFSALPYRRYSFVAPPSSLYGSWSLSALLHQVRWCTYVKLSQEIIFFTKTSAHYLQRSLCLKTFANEKIRKSPP